MIPHREPVMISWVDKLDSLMPKNDPDYDRFQKFKKLWKETIAAGIAAKNRSFRTDADYDMSWLKVLPDPKDCDGEVPNIKGLKGLLDKLIKYTSSWNNTGINDIDNRMSNLCVEAVKCKNVLDD